MRITGLGHAGMFIETAGGNIICDPVLGPSFFGSWFPFPDNRGLDWERFGREADFLYISHRHRDHFDPKLLERYIRKDIEVLLPEYPIDDLEQDIRALGYTNITYAPAGEIIERGDLKIMITPLRAPSDGPIGDSSLSVDDGTGSILNQNDSHPLDLDTLLHFGKPDAYFTQVSGAIWWPMVYDLPMDAKQNFAKLKRDAQNKRAIQLLKDAGIVAEAQFIVGLENETAQTLEETYQMAQDWKPDMANWCMYTPWPFSDLFQELGDKVQVFDFEKYNFVTPIMKPDAMERGELLDRVMHNYRRFYMRKAFLEWPWIRDKTRRKYMVGCLKAFAKSGFQRTFYDLGRVGYWGPQTKKRVDFKFADQAVRARPDAEAVQPAHQLGQRHAAVQDAHATFALVVHLDAGARHHHRLALADQHIRLSQLVDDLFRRISLLRHLPGLLCPILRNINLDQ